MEQSKQKSESVQTRKVLVAFAAALAINAGVATLMAGSFSATAAQGVQVADLGTLPTLVLTAAHWQVASARQAHKA